MAAPLCLSGRDLESLLRDPLPALVAFEASGCGPCALLDPLLEEVCREFGARARVLRVLDGGDASVAARYHLLWIPTLAFWRSQREVLRLSGAAPLEALRDHLRYLLEDGPVPPTVLGPRRAVTASFQPHPAF